MSALSPEPTRQTAPAPHFPHTEFLSGKVTAACPCGWRAVASSHEHSVTLGEDHVKERAHAARQAAAAEATRPQRVADLGASIDRIVETGGYFPELNF